MICQKKYFSAEVVIRDHSKMDYVDIDEKMSDEKIVTTVIIMLEGGKDYPIFGELLYT